MNAAILLAAGSGRRMQGTVEDKVLVPLAGKPVLSYAIEAFLESACVECLSIVVRDKAQQTAIEALVETIDLGPVTVCYTQGGTERQYSVHNALKNLPIDCGQVYIHDCARPLLRSESIKELCKTVERDGAAVLAHPVVDTIKRIQSADTTERVELEDLDRSRLWAMETPQAFRYTDIFKAYQHVIDHRLTITDDTAAAATIGLKISMVANEHPNPKLTTAQDLVYMEWLLKSR